MKVILSSDSIKFPLTGIGRYSYELIKAFREIDDIRDLKFLNGYSVSDKLDFEHSVSYNDKATNFKTNILSLLKSTFAADVYRLFSPLLKEKALSSYSDYIFHGTNFFVPKFSGKSISTFHDLSPFLMPHCIEPKRRDYLQKQLTSTVSNASFFITDTYHTRNEFINHFGVDANKVKAVHLACDSSFKVRKEVDVSNVLKKYGLNFKKFSLCVCTIEPRKNLDILIDAYSGLPSKIRAEYPLVLVGHEGWCSEKTHKKMMRYSNEGWLRYLRFVHNDELPLIYSGARTFVFPSLYEGFGLPILEAMSSGVPVLCSDASCLPEVGGDSALYFNPNDTDALKNLLFETLDDDSLLNHHHHLGVLRAKEFSWNKCALETLEVYKLVNAI